MKEAGLVFGVDTGGTFTDIVGVGGDGRILIRKVDNRAANPTDSIAKGVESLAREIAPFGARANAILPGTMDTPANRASMPDADPSQWVTTDAIASVIHFLTTPAAAAINGAAIRVPGPKP